ncbi:MAG: hypothetical protein H7Z43_02950, partial [Clostridia bacterium]|nr:hypothetical protein [Deltaproteobacteria bacterium]
PPSVVESGTPFAATVVVRDDWRNIFTGYTGTIDLTSTGSLTGSTSHTFGLPDTGQYIYDPLTLNGTSGAFSMTASDGIRTSGAVDIRVIDVGGVASFRMTPQPVGAPIVANAQFNVLVEALDVNDNRITSASGYILLQSSDRAASDANAYLQGGQVTVPWTFRTVGPQHLTVNYQGILSQSPYFTVNPGAAASYSFVTQPPANVIAGNSFAIALQVLDAYGNALPASSYTATLGLSGTGGTLTGATETKVGTVSYFNTLRVTGAGTFTLFATFVPAVQAGASSSPFVVALPGCPQAFVSTTGKADGSGCSALDPVNTIGRAAQVVDRGGSIVATGGTFTETLVFDRGVSFTLTGGFNTAFNAKGPPTMIIGADDATQTLECTGSSTITLDDVIVKAPDVSTDAIVEHSAVLADSGCTLTIQNSRIQGTNVDKSIPSAGVVITDAKIVVLANNFIHSGNRKGAESVQSLYGVDIRGSGEASVSIVNNTIYVPVSTARSACVTISASGAAATLTNNLLVGDFRNCTNDSGTCSGYENAAQFASAQNNVVLNAEPGGAAAYISYGGRDFAKLVSLNDHPLGSPRYADNAFSGGEIFTTRFVDFNGSAGADVIEQTDWHITNDNKIRVGKNPAGTTCGFDSKTSCGGLLTDFDGDERPAEPVCSGADEISAAATTKFTATTSRL